jgi:hypothetical protein
VFSLATKEHNSVARPLRILVPLIKQDFEDAEGAGLPHYQKAGEKLVEARSHDWEDADAFWNWASAEFNRGKTQLKGYMRLARDTASGKLAARRVNTLDQAMGPLLVGSAANDSIRPACP